MPVEPLSTDAEMSPAELNLAHQIAADYRARGHLQCNLDPLDMSTAPR